MRSTSSAIRHRLGLEAGLDGAGADLVALDAGSVVGDLEHDLPAVVIGAKQ